MKSWVPSLVEELKAGREPVLVQAVSKNLAKAAVLDSGGRLLAGDLGSSKILDMAKSRFSLLTPARKASVIVSEDFRIIMECQKREDLYFWTDALADQEDSWAAWLLTIPQGEEGDFRITRHILAALGPWTNPRLPEDYKDLWSLLPLNAGLGRLYVFGEDELALETAALSSRAGLKVTLVSVNPCEQDLEAAQNIGDFNVMSFADWSAIDENTLAEIGLRPGVFVLITTDCSDTFMEAVREIKTGWLGLAGLASTDEEPGLFPAATTAAQKALGLIAAMLGRH